MNRLKTILLTALLALSVVPAHASKIQKQGIVDQSDCATRGVANSSCLPSSHQVYDDINGQLLDTTISNLSSTIDAQTLSNLGLSTSVSAGALTVNLTQANGSSNPASAAGLVGVSMRSSTATTGAFNYRTISSALSGSLSSGTTLGMLASQNNYLWIYLIDSDGAGTMKIGLSTVQYDDQSLQNTVKESFSTTATSASPAVFTASGHNLVANNGVRLTGTPPTGFSTGTTYYVVAPTTNTFELSATPGGSAINSSSTGSSIVTHVADFALTSTAAYTAVPIRLIGRAQFNLATSGTWIAPTELSLDHTLISQPQGIAARYTSSSTTAAGGAQDVVMVFPTLVYDTHNAYSTSSGLFVCPLAGKYQVSATINSSASVTAGAVGESLVIKIQKNGVNVDLMSRYTLWSNSTPTGPTISGTDTVSCAAGDTLALGFSNNTTPSISGSGNLTTSVEFHRVGN